MTPEEIGKLDIVYEGDEIRLPFIVQREIAAQLAELNQSFKLFARDTEDIANLISHSVFCPCCNCHEEEEEPSGSTN